MVKLNKFFTFSTLITIFFLFSIIIQADALATKKKFEESSDDLRKSSHNKINPGQFLEQNKEEKEIACAENCPPKLWEQILRYALDYPKTLERDDKYVYISPNNSYFNKDLFNYRLVNKQFNWVICSLNLLTLHITGSNIQDFYETVVNWPKGWSLKTPMMFVASDPSLIKSHPSQYLATLERVFYQPESNDSTVSGPFILKGAEISNSIKIEDRLKIWKILKQSRSSLLYVSCAYNHMPDDDHKITEEEIDSLKCVISPGENSQLRVLALDFTQGGNCQKNAQQDYIGHILFRLIDNLKNHTSLEKFHSLFAHFSDPAATALAEILKVNESITTVGLQPNVMTITGVKNLFRGLQENTTLEILDIANGNYSKKAVLEELQWFLIKNKTIHTLHFGYSRTQSKIDDLIKTTKDESLKERLKGMTFHEATL